MDKKLIGFCTDCCEWREVDDKSGRGNCGHGRVACPPEGYRIIGPEEESRIRAEERERCAAVVRNRGKLYEAAAERYTTPGPNQQKAHNKAGTAFRLANEILNHGDTDYVCVRREELEAIRRAGIEYVFPDDGHEYQVVLTCEGRDSFDAVADAVRSLLKEKE